MTERKHSKITYAQSSDIKSRTWLEYRRDMKKKAIAELEIIPWLESNLKKAHKTTNVKVRKSGGDAFLWFLPPAKGTITQEPDYIAEIDGQQKQMEFQYSKDDALEYFDFKVSKIGKKDRATKKRIAFEDREFIYLIMSNAHFAYITPKWILNKGKEGGVPAWGNRTAYRVQRDAFLKLFKHDSELEKFIQTIHVKNEILEFQNGFLRQEKSKMSQDVQLVIDEKRTFKIIPDTLKGFYEACLIMDNIKEEPLNLNMWLSYLLSFFSPQLNSHEVAQFIYSLDFLYSKFEALKETEIQSLSAIILRIEKYVKNNYNGGLYKTSDKIAPLDEARNFAFISNLLEDMIQSSIYQYNADLTSIRTIFSTLPDYQCIFDMIRKNTEG